MSDLVSVIIPTYNARQYVGDAIDSALAQTYKHVEIIVVDDGSSDGTGDLLKDKYGDRIKYIYKANGGPASARNLGIKNSRGEFIAFLDADDLWLPEKLEYQIKVFADGIVMVGGVEKTKNDGSFQTIGFNELVLKNRFSNSGVMVRRPAFEEVGLFDESREVFAVEDWDMWLRLSHVGRLCLLHMDLLTIRVTENSISAPAQAEKMLKSEICVLKKHLQGRPLLYCRALSNRYLSSAWALNECNRRGDAFKSILLTYWFFPFYVFDKSRLGLFIKILINILKVRKPSAFNSREV